MPLENSLQVKIDQLFSEYDRPTSPGCALGVIHRGELAYSCGYGMANLEHRVPIDADTVFHLASVSKQFTATCIALLEESGELSLDDSIRRYIPWLPEYGHDLNLGHLVHMTNGLEDFYEVSFLIMGLSEEEYFSQDEAVEIIRGANWLKFAPGEHWSYSNTGYFLLARIIETISDQPFYQFVRENIFDPLRMKNTFVRTDRRAIIPKRADGYARLEFIHYKDADELARARLSSPNGYGHQFEPLEISGAGQVWSTIHDLYRWDQNFYHNTLGKKDPGLIQKLTTPGKLNDGTPLKYAYGQVIGERNGLQIISHQGGASGVNTIIYRIPAKGLSVICLANSNDFFTTMLKQHGEEIYEKIAGMISPWLQTNPKNTKSRKTLKMTIGEGLEDFTGSFEDTKTSHIWEITAPDGGLSVLENFADTFKLTPVTNEKDATEHIFEIEGQNLRCIFRRSGAAGGGPCSEIRVGEGTSIRIFQRFLTQPLNAEISREYAGTYICRRLNAGYQVTPVQKGIALKNLNPCRGVLDLLFTPTIKDMFIARYPPFLNWYVIHFRRDPAGQVVEFAFRDEVPGRENWVFEKLGIEK